MWRRSAGAVIHSKSTARAYHVLAIESSCDDSAVCLIDRQPHDIDRPNQLLAHKVRTLDSTETGGIVPSDALVHHLQNIAPMVREILDEHNLTKVDLVCATRGPGMYASLSAGLNVAKGLAVAWNVPFIGVHHMLGHLLTPRFFTNGHSPKYPFVSLLASGGHTMLVLSQSPLVHEILANTVDIAIGDSLDKCAREIGLKGNILGKKLEDLSNDTSRHQYTLPADQIKLLESIKFPSPLKNSSKRSNHVAFSFAGFITAVKNTLQKHPIGEPDAQAIVGKLIQLAILNHLVSKVKLACEKNDIRNMDFVLAGGVASNMLLRDMLRTGLCQQNLSYHFPEVKWCTDNALMIGWAGIELWESARLHTNVGAMPVAKWPLSDIINVDSWMHR